MKIFLIRHGESIANTGENELIRKPDNNVYLTNKGVEQAKKSATFLKNFILENNIDMSHARAWISPYDRTRQTFETFNKEINFVDCREDIHLVEQQFGLFDSVPDEKWADLYPNEAAYYQHLIDHKGKFWARLPLGESPFDVAIRVKSFFGTIQRDLEKHGVDTLFIFTHGVTLRVFLMQYMHYSVEWYQEEKNPKNCWVRFIDDKIDNGYIYKEIEERRGVVL